MLALVVLWVAQASQKTPATAPCFFPNFFSGQRLVQRFDCDVNARVPAPAVFPQQFI